jgi:hypothetical protein
MKHIFILLLSTTIAFAQQNLINGNFEDTLAIRNQSDTTARSWTRSDFGSGVTADAHDGTSAVYIWNWYYYAKGEITNGASSFSGGGGTPIDFSPSQLTGFFKYIPGDVDTENDSAVAVVCLTRYNVYTSRRDTVGYGITYFTATPDYTAFNLDIDYTSTDVPDTVTVKFRSSIKGFCANTSSGNCLFLYVDEVTLKDEGTGIRDAVEFKDKLNIFPNPATEKIRVNIDEFSNDAAIIRIYNTLGEAVIGQEITEASSALIDIRALPRGAYVVKVHDAVGRFVKE